jgi:hypothetical protein
MTLALRRFLVVLTVLLAGFAVTACSSSTAGTPGATGTSGSSGTAFMDVQLKGTSILIANKAGQQLKDVYLSIRPGRGSSVYQMRLTRMESTERREIPLADFKTPGGLPWRSGKPAQFAANAQDFVGAKREMTLALN